jgi:two-component sensor histidine kinase
MNVKLVVIHNSTHKNFMQSRKQRNLWTQSVLTLVLLLPGILPVPTAPAQVPPTGRLLYDKLAKTQRDYQAAMATGDSEQVAQACYDMGKRYGAFGEYVTAENWYVRSLRIREPHGPSEVIGKTYLRLSENWMRQKQYQSAMRCARLGMSNVRIVNSKHGIMSAYIVLAGVHQMGWKVNRENPGSISGASLDSSLYYFGQAERLALKLNKPLDIGLVYYCKGEALMLKGSRQALPYLKKSYAIQQSLKQAYGIINLSIELAECYLSLKQPAKAKVWLDRAAIVRDTTRHGEYWQNSLLEETYAKLYQQTGDWKQAFAHREKYHDYQLASLNADREGAMSRIATQYESEKKEIALKAQQKHLDTQKELTLLATLLALLFGVACVLLFLLFRKYRRISEYNARLVKEQNHRAKNNLQSITNLLGLQSNRLTDPAARKAVEESLMRVEAMALVHRRLYDSDHLAEVDLMQFIPELVEGVLRSYSLGDIQPLYSLSPIWLRADVAINLGLLLNELVTNACKYALPHHPAPVLEIGCQEEKGRILLWFSDNGPGFTPTVAGNSFGMKLIDIITKKLNGKGKFETEKGCHFTLSFDVKPSFVLQ